MTNEMERAFYASDPAWDGRFVAAVRTTGIFCRPSCRVRKPSATQRRVPGRCLRRSSGGLPALPALPARGVDAGDPARRRDADRAPDDRRHRSRRRAVRLQRAADDAVPAGFRPPADRPDELRRRAAARPRRRSSCGSTSPAPATSSTCRSTFPGAPSSSGSGPSCAGSRTARRSATASSPSGSTPARRTGPSAGPTARTGWRSSCPATAWSRRAAGSAGTAAGSTRSAGFSTSRRASPSAGVA